MQKTNKLRAVLHLERNSVTYNACLTY